MALEGTEITTPPGRIVWGHPAKVKNKTDQRNQPVFNAQGQPVQQWAFGVAFDKVTFQQAIWPAMAAEVAKGFPNGIPPAFSWKYVDGDGVDRNGQPYANREGYAGCYVLSISTELMAPPIFKFNGTGYDQLAAEMIKTGDYVSLGLNLKVHVPTDRSHTPGLYVNPLAIEFVGYGSEIVGQGAADPKALFGGRQHQLPPGASATPIGNAGAPGMPGMGQQAPMQAAPQGYPAPGGMPGQPQYAPQPAPGGMPGQMPPPAHDFVPQAGAPAPAGYPAPGGMPQAPAGYPAPGGMPQAPAGYPAPGGMPGQPGMMPPR